MIQIVTGICLALVYVPSVGQAYTSLEYLNYQQQFGWFLRAMHNWGSNFMVAIMLAHLIQVFLFGAFKYPREMTWISGVVLLLCTLGMAFTGQVLRFDQDAYWGLGNWGSDGGPCSFNGTGHRSHDARWTNHRRRDTVALFHAARVCHSRNHHRNRQPAPQVGAQQRNQ